MTTDESSPPIVAEPDTLRGELIERCTVMIDSALAGSTFAAAILANALQNYAPSLIPAMVARCGRARARKE